ncbi:MAG: flagellar export chaperone FliS [Gammaproteobacteria bacterium]|nr:flagellar export chaperone FliS [Gammaproteobacteria bacterium]MBU1646201.1 flagellar export chaperone FliS [Gammaproteobacteria bacterium]MBU1972263.1 flagellar export chaperone FliS [Gammaproteobacteria bacterium]
MFQTMSSAKAAYGKVGLDMSVETASPHKLVLMLYDGALLALASAGTQLKSGDKMAMSESILKASSIIGQGLRDSLDAKVGGELAVRLTALYDYMCVRLQLANIRGDQAAINEVVGLLHELRGAWEEIGKDQTAVPPSKAAA